MNKTKVIAEITQSNNEKEFIKALIENGVDLFLLDLYFTN